MHASPFETELTRLGRTLTEQYGVDVICQGDNAWTNGKRIVLPLAQSARHQHVLHSKLRKTIVRPTTLVEAAVLPMVGSSGKLVPDPLSFFISPRALFGRISSAS